MKPFVESLIGDHVMFSQNTRPIGLTRIGSKLTFNVTNLIDFKPHLFARPLNQ